MHNLIFVPHNEWLYMYVWYIYILYTLYLYIHNHYHLIYVFLFNLHVYIYIFIIYTIYCKNPVYYMSIIAVSLFWASLLENHELGLIRLLCWDSSMATALISPGPYLTCSACADHTQSKWAKPRGCYPSAEKVGLSPPP